MPAPLVSVLIPAYNAGRWIGETLASARAQTWPALEIVVVDDGSADDTLAHARRHAAEDTRVRVLTGPNRGASAARNQAFAASAGAYIQCLDADDLLAPDKIERQVARLLAEDPGGIRLATAEQDIFIDDPAEAAFRPNGLWTDFPDPIAWLVHSWTTGEWIQYSGFLLPRGVIERAGPWDERLTLHDDGEYFTRVLLHCGGILHCPGARAYYRKDVERSLSATVHTPRAMQSFLLQCTANEQNLLAAEDSPRTRRAAATLWQNFYYTYYPRYRKELAIAAAAVHRLGGSDAKPRGSALFHRLSKIMGWKAARRLEAFALAHGLNPAALRKRFS